MPLNQEVIIQKQYLYDGNDSSKMLLERLHHSFKKEGSPNVEKVVNGIILPRIATQGSWGIGGVCTQDLEFVQSSAERGFGGSYPIKQTIVKKYNFSVVYLGYLIPHWGVFLVDFTRRLYYFLKEHNNNLKITFCGIKFEKGSYGNISEKCNEFWSLLGIEKENIIDIREPSQFNSVLIPEPAYEYDSNYYDDFLLPFKLMASKVSAKRPQNKIYFTRMRFKKKKESGEKYIEKFFKNNGFTIVSPEQLSLRQQIDYVANAECIASIEGTIAHNILFAKPGTKQIIIRKQSEINSRQHVFNQITHTDIQYIAY